MLTRKQYELLRFINEVEQVQEVTGFAYGRM